MESKTQYSMHFTDPSNGKSINIDGMPYHMSFAEDHTRVRLQRDLCSSILTANRSGILTLSDGEMSVVRAMKGSGKPLKDTHIAVLRALVERAK